MQSTSANPVTASDLSPQELERVAASKLPSSEVALWKAVHRHAMARKRDTYTDPSSGNSVFTHHYLAQQDCCGNGCRHCPHGHVNCPAWMRPPSRRHSRGSGGSTCGSGGSSEGNEPPDSGRSSRAACNLLLPSWLQW